MSKKLMFGIVQSYRGKLDTDEQKIKFMKQVQLAYLQLISFRYKKDGNSLMHPSTGSDPQDVLQSVWSHICDLLHDEHQKDNLEVKENEQEQVQVKQGYVEDQILPNIVGLPPSFCNKERFTAVTGKIFSNTISKKMSIFPKKMSFHRRNKILSNDELEADANTVIVRQGGGVK